MHCEDQRHRNLAVRPRIVRNALTSPFYSFWLFLDILSAETGLGNLTLQEVERKWNPMNPCQISTTNARDTHRPIVNEETRFSERPKKTHSTAVPRI